MFMSKVHKIWEIVEKLKTDVDRLLLVFKMKNSLISQNISEILLLVSKMKKSLISQNILEFFFSIIKTKSSLSSSVFIFSIISQILKTKFYVFWTQTCIEIGPNCSHELSTFPKYHMPLRNFILEI